MPDNGASVTWSAMRPFLGDRLIRADVVEGWAVLTFEDGHRVMLAGHDSVPDVEVFTMAEWRERYGNVIG